MRSCDRLARPKGVEDRPSPFHRIRLASVNGAQELTELGRRGFASLQERSLVFKEGIQFRRREAVGTRVPRESGRDTACTAIRYGLRRICSAGSIAKKKHGAREARASEALTLAGALMYDRGERPDDGGLEATVKVYLVRHADADAEVPDGLDDAARSLTARAREKARAHFAALRPRMPNVSLILTSPLVRAVQTAQILALAQELEVPLRAHRSLLPDMPVGSLDGLLEEHTGEDIVLVGHNPSMPAMAAHLLSIQAFPRAVAPGTVIGLERALDSNRAQLLFFAQPGLSVTTTLGT